MRNKLLYILFLLSTFSTFAQKEPREIVHGRVVADSMKVDNIMVRNLTSKIKAVTDEKGFFTLYARPKDTLLFESITFRPAQLVLQQEHFNLKQLIVRLDVNVTMLDEVVIRPSALLGNLEADTKNLKTMTTTSGLDSRQLILTAPPEPQSPLNEKRYPTESVLKGFDFVKIYDLYFRKPKKKNKGEIYAATATKSFTESVKERYTYHFFTEQLKIPHKEIGLFLTFCDKGDETRGLLAPKKEFELIDYLVTKSIEYLKKER